MSGYAFTAGEELTAEKVNLYLATQYLYAEDGTSRTVGTPTSTWNDFTGALSLDITVNATGVLLVRWGAEGRNTNSDTATCRLGVNLSGANSASATTNLSCCFNVGTGSTFMSASRMHIFTGLSTGTTTVKLQGYISSGTTGTVDNQFLYVQNFL